MNKQEIEKYTNRSLSVIDKQIQVTNNILAEYDIFNELLNRENIRGAAELAITSRKYLDQYYDKNEIEDANIELLVQKVYSRIQSGLFEQKAEFSISVPKNRHQDRRLVYYDLPSYTIRYLIALII